MKKPAVVEVNRFGLSFGKSRTPNLYASSKREFKAYYRFVCHRCGWAFAGNSHRNHRLDDCDAILAERKKDALANKHALRNLYGAAR